LDHECSEALLKKNQTTFGPFIISNASSQKKVEKPAKKPKTTTKPPPSQSEKNQLLRELHKQRVAQHQAKKVVDLTQPVIDLTKDEEPKPSTTSRIPTNTTYQKKSKQLAKQFSNSKQKAIGQSSIEPPNRF
jgi:hypothetical protein